MARKNKEDGGGFGWKRFLAYVSTISLLVVFAGLLVGLTLGMRPLEARAFGHGLTAPTKVRFVWPTAPGTERSWLPQADQERLLRVAQDAVPPDASPLSREPLERLCDALAGTGWFVGSPTATRERGGGVTITGEWRVPAAVVRSKGRDYLVSWEGLPMPAVYTPGEARLRYIEEPGTGVPTLTGGGIDYSTAWPGEGLAASLELLRLVLAQPWAGQVAGIDASAYPGTSTLVLVTGAGNRVVWGGRPSRPLLGEVSTRAKLDHLAQLQHDFRSVDAGHPVLYVNYDSIQFDSSASATLKPGGK